MSQRMCIFGARNELALYISTYDEDTYKCAREKHSLQERRSRPCHVHHGERKEEDEHEHTDALRRHEQTQQRVLAAAVVLAFIG